jgi:hypothetical protein
MCYNSLKKRTKIQPLRGKNLDGYSCWCRFWCGLVIDGRLRIEG